MANYNGVVKWFDAVKGYGFITSDNGEDVFIHFSNIKEEGNEKNLHEGEEVSFDMVEAPRGMSAINVQKL